MSNRVASIEQKIEELRQKKKDIQQRETESLAKLITKCGLGNIDKDILAGALLAIANEKNENKKEEWRVEGQKFHTSKHLARVQKTV